MSPPSLGSWRDCARTLSPSKDPNTIQIMSGFDPPDNGMGTGDKVAPSYIRARPVSVQQTIHQASEKDPDHFDWIPEGSYMLSTLELKSACHPFHVHSSRDSSLPLV